MVWARLMIWAVHPRVYGELIKRGGTLNCDNGSSLRVRGTLIGIANAHAHARFIPACAGNA